MQKSRIYVQYQNLIGVLIICCVVGALRLNNAHYFNLIHSYDIGAHLHNVEHIMEFGTLPPLELDTYEAHQVPLYYVLTAWWLLGADTLGIRGDFFTLLPPVLFALAMIWTVMVAVVLMRLLKQISIELRILGICVVLLFPVNTMVTTMFNNELMVMLFGTAAIFTLWTISRSNRLLDRRLWLRAALFCALAMAFKSNGTIYMAVYGSFAICVTLYFLWKRQFEKIKQFIIVAGIGVPFMLMIWVPNAWHSSRHVEPLREEFLIISPSVITPEFFYTFDIEIFRMPFAFGPGESSFWSLQYVNIHSDYYNHWSSWTYASYPAYEMMVMPHRFPMPRNRFRAGLLLQILSIPIMLVMVGGFVVSAYRLIRSPRRAILDGSLVVVLFAVMAQAAQVGFLLLFPYIRYAVIHSRYSGFLWGFLFLIGLMWLSKLGRRNSIGQFIMFILFINMILYGIIAMYFMWLPPL